MLPFIFQIGSNLFRSKLFLMRSKISTPEVQPCSSVAAVLHLSRWKQILVVYQSYVRMSSWQPDVKLIQATLNMPEGRGCFCTAAQNYAEKAHQTHYCWMHLNGIIQVNSLSLSPDHSLLACETGGWRCIIDWCDAAFLSEVMSLSYSKAFLWQLTIPWGISGSCTE